MRFLRWCLILWCICAVGTGITLMLGKQQPLPLAIAALHLDECELPCWIGIVPGKTLISDARLQLQRVYGDQSDYQLHTRGNLRFNIDILIKESGDLFNINIEPVSRDDIENSTVRYITILFRPVAVHSTSWGVGSLASQIEMPTSIGQSPTVNGYKPLFFFNNNRVLVYLNEVLTICRRISVTAPVTVLYLMNEGLSESALGLLPQKKWAGFKSCYDFSN